MTPGGGADTLAPAFAAGAAATGAASGSASGSGSGSASPMSSEAALTFLAAPSFMPLPLNAGPFVMVVLVVVVDANGLGEAARGTGEYVPERPA